VAGVDQDESWFAWRGEAKLALGAFGCAPYTAPVKMRLLSPPASSAAFSQFFPEQSMSPNLHPMINVAVKAARAAGSIINRAALDIEVRAHLPETGQRLRHRSGPRSRASDHRNPAHRLPRPRHLGRRIWREHGAKDSEFVWIIDPLDGTTNFIHGLPVYCVSIALAVKGKIEQAVSTTPPATTCSLPPKAAAPS
jgi:myo-inositol-1(or 4)-monophosphatase